jgi:hypothetical protein
MDDHEEPTEEVVETAKRLTNALEILGFPSPIRAVPDGFGGVALQWERDNVFFSVTVSPQLNLRSLCAVNGSLLEV